MKLSGWLLRISLILMITISLVFTWLIWQNPSRLGSQQATVAVKTKADPNVAKQKALVYAPNTAYYQGQHQKYQLLINDQMVTQQLRSKMRNWQLGKLSKAATLSSANFEAQLTMPDTLQLVYPTSITFSTFDRTFFKHRAAGTNPEFKFNRLVVTLGATTTRLHLIDDATRTMRIGTLSNVTKDGIRKIIATGQDQGYPVTEVRLGTREIADYRTAIRVQPYLYLLDQQSANHYVAQLIPTQETSAVDSREIGGETVYTAGSDYRLTETMETGVMAFEDAAATNPSGGMAKILSRAYTAVGSLGLTGLTYMRYAGYDAAGQTVTFRSYAQGLPIFNSDYYGRVAVAVTSSGLQMTFSSNNLTVPIPTKQPRVTLPSTATLLARLREAGYPQSQIQDVTLGYNWAKQGENSQLVTLTPTYFVEINNEYRSYTDWLTLQTKATTQTAPQAKAN
ncbi:YycH family regulatory protein [Lacticaseibacillus nasuensis]|uniref:Regulatory protein YycH domain-containing protein n=1 Tax=Lacticaseibacillus nasuensis JCM 17158 TaxID=1291734 RepID=A0A0R1JZI0_9LACO|nr:two-component system activity regulator YycH [Lacticaseibacillus nasuensis]KRK73972.1 hypothetical protein FD02_GL001806 [Lacticaseibacillus nasuensis JCM 17158]